MRHFIYLIIISIFLVIAGCEQEQNHYQTGYTGPDDPFLDELQSRTFQWFWDWSNPVNGLVPVRVPSVPAAHLAGAGFGLTSYAVGVERGYITREMARERTVRTLRTFWEAPQGEEPLGNSGYRGFFYRFLHPETGVRHGAHGLENPSELSTMDTSLFMAGVLFAQSYYDQDHPQEEEIRALADSLYQRVEWTWFHERHPLISMSWRPEPEHPATDPETRKSRHDYTGYNEAMILYILALGSPTHPIDEEAWEAYTSTYLWEDFYGYEHVNFSPLFGHQFSHVWVDFRGIQDEYMREKGIDYFENSRRATLAQREYGIDNPNNFRDYSGEIWGWTACDGPGYHQIDMNGDTLTTRGYWARGVSARYINDDGTITPTASAGSMPFTPEESITALKAMINRYGDLLYHDYGFWDSFNPTFTFTDLEVQRGVVDPEMGWFNGDKLVIDQGPILLMTENYRSELIWDVMRTNPHIIRGLCRAGFSGGWLEGKCS